jgi:hypothetical protein
MSVDEGEWEGLTCEGLDADVFDFEIFFVRDDMEA